MLVKKIYKKNINKKKTFKHPTEPWFINTALFRDIIQEIKQSMVSHTGSHSVSEGTQWATEHIYSWIFSILPGFWEVKRGKNGRQAKTRARTELEDDVKN